jgi:hypothetical protein
MVHLFDLGSNYPKKDFKAFQLAQALLGITRQRLMLEKEKIIPVFKRTLGFDDIEEVDWVWITQDFNLFVLEKLAEKMVAKNVWI